MWKHLGLVWDLIPFEQTHRLVKTDKQKREFQGPECHKLLRKLSELRDYLPEELHTFVDILEEIKEVYKISHAKEIVPNHLVLPHDILWPYNACEGAHNL